MPKNGFINLWDNYRNILLIYQYIKHLCATHVLKLCGYFNATVIHMHYIAKCAFMYKDSEFDFRF